MLLTGEFTGFQTTKGDHKVVDVYKMVDTSINNIGSTTDNIDEVSIQLPLQF